jgi:uncharacterized protein (DUF952 family)
MNITYHGTPKSYWQSLDPKKPYVPADYGKDGFIHTTDGAEAISMTLTRFYKSNLEPFVLLHIDKDAVTSPIRYDDPAEIFPHIYGPLNRDAILAVEDIRRSGDGTFCKPALKW